LVHLGFNIYAFVQPTTRAEVSALLSEAIRLAEELEEHVDRMDAILQGKGKRATA
jgi:hypothetical protein